MKGPCDLLEDCQEWQQAYGCNPCDTCRHGIELVPVTVSIHNDEYRFTFEDSDAIVDALSPFAPFNDHHWYVMPYADGDLAGDEL